MREVTSIDVATVVPCVMMTLVWMLALNRQGFEIILRSSGVQLPISLGGQG